MIFVHGCSDFENHPKPFSHVFFMTGVRADGGRPRLADTYFNKSLTVERIAPAPDNTGTSQLGTVSPDSPCPTANRDFSSGVKVIRVLSIFNGRQIRSTTSDS